MVVRTVKTNMHEADSIFNRKISFMFRSDKECIKAGDVIQFLCIKDKHSVFHKISSKFYVVTAVIDNMNAPVIKGYQLVAFRELS